MSNKKIATIVERIVRKRLSGTTIDAVYVKPDTGWDGDPILNVTVVVDTTKAAHVDPGKRLGLGRLVQTGLEGVSDGFPIFSFVSKKEAAKLNLEAA